jgi:hypothetical protein
MIKDKFILCSISTRGRYNTTLPLAIMSVVNQTYPPNKLIIYDDNENPIDVREIQIYQYLFQMLELKGIEFEWVYAQKKRTALQPSNGKYSWI